LKNNLAYCRQEQKKDESKKSENEKP